jgi:molybdopterin-guanine dinucleotide biosynthesis protein B
VVVEGFKQEPIPKIEVYRPNLNKPMLAKHDPHIMAIAADAHVATDLPLLDLNDPNAIADFIMQWLQQQRANLKLVSSR